MGLFFIPFLISFVHLYFRHLFCTQKCCVDRHNPETLIYRRGDGNLTAQFESLTSPRSWPFTDVPLLCFVSIDRRSPTMVPLRNNTVIGQRNGMSIRDCFKVNSHYGCLNRSPYDRLKYSSICQLMGVRNNENSFGRIWGHISPILRTLMLRRVIRAGVSAFLEQSQGAGAWSGATVLHCRAATVLQCRCATVLQCRDDTVRWWQFSGATVLVSGVRCCRGSVHRYHCIETMRSSQCATQRWRRPYPVIKLPCLSEDSSTRWRWHQLGRYWPRIHEQKNSKV